MTTPDGYIPEGAGTVSDVQDLQNLNEAAIKKQLQQPAVDLFGKFKNNQLNLLAGVVNFFGSAMLGAWTPVDPDDVDLSSGQLKINGRTDLLDGVRGYCATFQSRNVDSGKQEGVFSHGLPGYRLLPFNRQLGPAKGAHPHPDGGIVFDEPGLWTVYVYTFLGDASNLFDAAIGTSLWVRMAIWDRDSRLSGASKFDSLEWTESDKAGVFNVATFSVPVVVPSAGYMVTVEGKGTHNRWWRGGTRYSRLAVVKHDNRVGNPPQETVPDEPV